ncbi:MAG: c-type cytochrome [Gammaproteobacteria bacterium]
MKLSKIVIAGALLALAGSAFAAGDVKAGKAKAKACFDCHGVNGVSTNPLWPKLAGQHAKYTVKQLDDFKTGLRKDPVMSTQVAALSDQDMADLGAFFAAQQVSLGGADETLVEAGKKIYHGGIKDKKVAACMGCHGPAGNGNPPAGFPALNGQYAAYVSKTMQDFRSGARSNDPNKMMRDIASRMSDADIKAVAAYIQGLH